MTPPTRLPHPATLTVPLSKPAEKSNPSNFHCRYFDRDDTHVARAALCSLVPGGHKLGGMWGDSMHQQLAWVSWHARWLGVSPSLMSTHACHRCL